MRARTFLMTLGVVVTGSTLAEAEPILLASFDALVNGGHAPETDPRVEFVLQLPSTFPPSAFFGIGQGVFWGADDEGSYNLRRENDPEFHNFAQFATDGIKDIFHLWGLFPNGSGGGSPGSESELFGRAPDLQGFELDYVRLNVHSIEFEPWIPFPDVEPVKQGFTYQAEITYEFYGIPEPSTLLLLLMSVAFAANRKTKSVWKEAPK